MSEPAAKTDITSILRDMAETRLKAGTTQKSGGYSLGVDALNLLHRLSSNPDTAADALKLLHELQVHQVEIDLQNETIQNHERVLADELDQYRELYEDAPVGYFLVDLKGRILKGNRAGAELFDEVPDQLHGHQISHFLGPDSQSVLTAILEKLHQGDSAQTGEVHTAGSGSRPLRVIANLSPDKRCAMVVCCEVS